MINQTILEQKCRRCSHYRAFRNYFFCDIGDGNTERCLRENGSWFAPRNTMYEVPQIAVLEIGEVEQEEPNA